MLAHDLPADELLAVALQVGQLARQLVQLVEGDHADRRIFQRDGLAGVALGGNAVQAQQFAGHLEASDLVAAVCRRQAG